MSVPGIYMVSRNTYRRWSKPILYLSILIALTGIGMFIIDSSQNLLLPYLFIPIYATLMIHWLEGIYKRKYGQELKDTTFWYLTGEKKSSRDNNWNTVIVLSVIVFPLAICMFLIILIK